MHNRSRMYLSSVIVSLALGCGSKQNAPSRPPAETAQQSHMCPMMKGAQATATDDEGGVAITFTTPDDPTELRARVRKMAAMHDRMSHGMMGSGERNGSAEMTGSAGMGSAMMEEGMHEHMAMVPSHAVVEDVDHGARVRITPDDPAQLATLREQVHAHVAMMNSGRCPMMERR